MTWTLGLGLSCLLGLVIGIVVRPYIIPNVSSSQLVKMIYCRVKLLTPCPTENCVDRKAPTLATSPRHGSVT